MNFNMQPPGSGSVQVTSQVSGRSYACAPNASIPVPDFDAPGLAAQGWIRVPNPSPSSPVLAVRATVVPLTGFAYQIIAGLTFLNPAGSLAAGTLILPPSNLVEDGEIITVSASQNINALTVEGQPDQTVNNAPSSILATNGFSMIFTASSATWDRAG